MYALVEPGMVDSIEAAKCWVARMVLLKAFELGFKLVQFEGDCNNVISFLRNDISLCPWFSNA